MWLRSSILQNTPYWRGISLLKAMMDKGVRCTHNSFSKHYHKTPNNFLESDVAKREFEALNSSPSGSVWFRELDSIYSDFYDAIEQELSTFRRNINCGGTLPWQSLEK